MLRSRSSKNASKQTKHLNYVLFLLSSFRFLLASQRQFKSISARLLEAAAVASSSVDRNFGEEIRVRSFDGRKAAR